MELNKTFIDGLWSKEINVTSFVQTNITPYLGDASFLQGPTERTKHIWNLCLKALEEERANNGVRSLDNATVSTITSHKAGYIDREQELIVGLQTDELLKHCFLMDPRSLAIKLVRLYKTEDPGLDKFYQKRCRRLKGEDGALVASTYAWIKLRQEQPEKAVAALVAAKKLSDNATLVENCDRLVNGKLKHFSNAGFGDAWYSLYLEEPKIKPQRQVVRGY